jgi:hypothetical protein
MGSGSAAPQRTGVSDLNDEETETAEPHSLRTLLRRDVTRALDKGDYSLALSCFFDLQDCEEERLGKPVTAQQYRDILREHRVEMVRMTLEWGVFIFILWLLWTTGVVGFLWSLLTAVEYKALLAAASFF